MKITDFGHSRSLKSPMLTLNENEPIPGNALYRAPELWRREEFNASVDLFSLAFLFWEVMEKKGYTSSILPQQYAKWICCGGRPKQSNHPLATIISNLWSNEMKNRPNTTHLLKSLTQIKRNLRL